MRQQVFQLAHLFDVVLHLRVQHLFGNRRHAARL